MRTRKREKQIHEHMALLAEVLAETALTSSAAKLYICRTLVATGKWPTSVLGMRKGGRVSRGLGWGWSWSWMLDAGAGSWELGGRRRGGRACR